MRILDLAQKDLLQILRDWKAAAFLVAMPVLFTLVFGAIFNSTEDPRIPVVVWDQDQAAFSGYAFMILETSQTLQPVEPKDGQTLDEYKAQVDEEQLAAVLIIPAGYSASLTTGTPIPLEFYSNPETGAGTTAGWGIQALASRLQSIAQAAAFSTQSYAQLSGFDTQAEQDAYFKTAFALGLASWETPPYALSEYQAPQANASEEAQAPPPNSYAHSSAGMMVQFALAGLISAGEVLVLERQSRALQRLLTTPIKRFEILAGHFLAILAMVLLQFTILIVFAQLLLDVPYFAQPAATILIALSTSIFAASTGLLIGTLSKTPEQVIIFALIPMFVLSGLGGAWMPLEFTSKSFQTIGHLTPLAWAMDGFTNITLRGLGLQAALLPAAILLAFAVGVSSLAIWRFRFE